MTATERHDGPDADPAGDEASPQLSARKARASQSSWAADNVPLIVLALIVVVLGIIGAVSNDSVTCPGGATSCNVP
ncbi:hypothetical protein ACWCQ1_50195 [Streptomyces sp. NPDC002144]